MMKQILRCRLWVSNSWFDSNIIIIFQVIISNNDSRIFVSVPDSSAEIAKKLMVHDYIHDEIRYPANNG